MIKQIKIRNFKSLKAVDLKLKHLNVITGINGVGKSSLIQSLLLLRQSFSTWRIYRRGFH
ncbi:MAG: AAA family ATPase [Chitinophagaceae bacterium]|nr:AAA family ATPase [Chitinophagaceae bacterium]